ncbi:Protein FAM221B [Apodemus speciosus]|uniref:Protein FAM221B n=1 Tax=Apodemus speciosus TaxID=105296 RepID=A0ABQ0ENL4_APOSI
MEANQTVEGPQSSKDAKEHPSLKDPDPEDLSEATTHETPLQLSSSQKYSQPPEVRVDTSASLKPDTKGSEDLWDPSVSETLLMSGVSDLLSPPSQTSPQSVTSLEKAIAEIPLEDLAFETLISEVKEEPPKVSPTASISKYETLISEVQKEHPEVSPTANIPEYETLISEVQKEPPEVSPTANIPEYETLIFEVQKEPLEVSPTTSIPESSHGLTSDTVPQTQVPESEHFQKQSLSEPSTQAKEDTPTKEGEAEEAERTAGTSKITAAKSALRAKKKKEKRAGGATSRPAVPAKRAELVEVAKAVHREQADDQVNNLFQWEKNSALKAIQTGTMVFHIPLYVGIYIGWRCPHYLWDCFRIGDESKCFCGHLLREHQIISEEVGCFCSSFESNFLCAACDRRWEEHETFFETEETRRRGKRPYGNKHRQELAQAFLSLAKINNKVEAQRI